MVKQQPFKLEVHHVAHVNFHDYRLPVRIQLEGQSTDTKRIAELQGKPKQIIEALQGFEWYYHAAQNNKVKLGPWKTVRWTKETRTGKVKDGWVWRVNAERDDYGGITAAGDKDHLYGEQWTLTTQVNDWTITVNISIYNSYRWPPSLEEVIGKIAGGIYLALKDIL